jgi:hypothetical protein
MNIHKIYKKSMEIIHNPLYVFLFFWLIALFFCFGINVSSDKFIFIPIMFLCAIIQFGLWLIFTKHERGGNWYHPVILFSFSFLICFFQNPICYSIGIEIQTSFLKDTSLFPHQCALALWAFTSFFVGYFLFAQKITPVYSLPINELFTQNELSPETWRKISVILMIPTFVCIISYYMTDGQLLVKGEYSVKAIAVMRLGGHLLSLSILLLQLSWICQLPYIFSQSPKTFREIFSLFDKRIFVLIIIYLLPCIYAGSRMRILTIILFLLSPICFYLKPFRLRSFIITGFISMFVLFSVLFYRALPSVPIQDKITQVKAKLMNFSNSANWPTSDLACVSNTFNATAYYHYKDKEFSKDHYTGKYTLLNSLLTISPSRQWMINKVGLTPVDYSPEHKLTRKITGSNNPTSYTDSSSLVIPLLDFGGLGISFLFVLFGHFLRFIEEKALRSNTSLLITFIYCTFPFIFFYGNRTDL